MEHDDFADYEGFFLTRPKLVENGIIVNPGSDYSALPNDALLVSDREFCDIVNASVFFYHQGDDEPESADAESSVVALRSPRGRVYLSYLASAGVGLAYSAGVVGIVVFALSQSSPLWSFFQGVIVATALTSVGLLVAAYSFFMASESGLVDLSFGRVKTVVRSPMGEGVLAAVCRAWAAWAADDDVDYDTPATEIPLWEIQRGLALIVSQADSYRSDEDAEARMSIVAAMLRQEIIDLAWSVETNTIHLDSIRVTDTFSEAVSRRDITAIAEAVESNEVYYIDR